MNDDLWYGYLNNVIVITGVELTIIKWLTYKNRI